MNTCIGHYLKYVFIDFSYEVKWMHLVQYDNVSHAIITKLLSLKSDGALEMQFSIECTT